MASTFSQSLRLETSGLILTPLFPSSPKYYQFTNSVDSFTANFLTCVPFPSHQDHPSPGPLLPHVEPCFSPPTLLSTRPTYIFQSHFDDISSFNNLQFLTINDSIFLIFSSTDQHPHQIAQSNFLASSPINSGHPIQQYWALHCNKQCEYTIQQSPLMLRYLWSTVAQTH